MKTPEEWLVELGGVISAQAVTDIQRDARREFVAEGEKLLGALQKLTQLVAQLAGMCRYARSHPQEQTIANQDSWWHLIAEAEMIETDWLESLKP